MSFRHSKFQKLNQKPTQKGSTGKRQLVGADTIVEEDEAMTPNMRKGNMIMSRLQSNPRNRGDSLGGKEKFPWLTRSAFAPKEESTDTLSRIDTTAS
jgi:hypothetical protein